MDKREMFILEAPIMPIFHNLPNVHKGCNPLLSRPMVAGIGSLNERLGEWIDHQLQPLVSALPGFIRDTKQLLTDVQNFKWDPDLVWITCNVASLYCSIPHSLGIQAVAYYLEHTSNYSLVH